MGGFLGQGAGQRLSPCNFDLALGPEFAIVSAIVGLIPPSGVRLCG